MSTSTLYEVYKTKANEIKEYRNGHGSAPPIWSHLGGEYLGWNGSMFNADMKPLWRLYKNPNIPECFRFALLFTFDGAILNDNYIQAADWSEEVYNKLYNSPYWGPDKVNHWKAISEDLRNYKPKKRALGLGLGCTSVCDPWESWPQGEIDEYFFIFKKDGALINED